MYKITAQKFGYLLTFSGFVDIEELADWYQESEEMLSERNGEPFGVVVDMRNITPLSVETRKIFQKGQQLYHNMGMQRSSVILTNAIALMQFKQVAKESGIYQWERYFDAELNPNWLKGALLWVQNGISSDR